MFDRTVVVKEGDRHENVTVNQQPNDAADAARLYGEIEEKAKARVKELVAHEALNTVRFVSYQQNRDFERQEDLYCIAFDVNGTTYSSTIKIDDYERVRAGDYLSVLENVVLPQMARSMMQDMIAKGRTQTLMNEMLDKRRF